MFGQTTDLQMAAVADWLQHSDLQRVQLHSRQETHEAQHACFLRMK
jgi:hypothetical protein